MSKSIRSSVIFMPACKFSSAGFLRARLMKYLFYHLDVRMLSDQLSISVTPPGGVQNSGLLMDCCHDIAGIDMLIRVLMQTPEKYSAENIPPILLRLPTLHQNKSSWVKFHKYNTANVSKALVPSYWGGISAA